MESKVSLQNLSVFKPTGQSLNHPDFAEINDQREIGSLNKVNGGFEILKTTTKEIRGGDIVWIHVKAVFNHLIIDQWHNLVLTQDVPKYQCFASEINGTLSTYKIQIFKQD